MGCRPGSPPPGRRSSTPSPPGARRVRGHPVPAASPATARPCVTEGYITRFHTGGGFLDTVGFAYAPDGVPASTGGEGSVDYELLTGPWYTFSQSW